MNNPRVFAHAAGCAEMTSAFYPRDSDSRRLVRVSLLEAPVALMLTSVWSLPRAAIPIYQSASPSRQSRVFWEQAL